MQDERAPEPLLLGGGDLMRDLFDDIWSLVSTQTISLCIVLLLVALIALTIYYGERV